MAQLTKEDIDKILGNQSIVSRVIQSNQPTVSAQKPSSYTVDALSNVLDMIRKPLDVYGLNKNIPLVGGTTVADVTGLNQVAPLAKDVAYGRPVVRGGSLQTMQADPRLAGVLDFVPAAGLATKAGTAGAKAGLKEIARQIETGTGIFGKGTIDPRMYAYLPDKPSKPNPLVGTRFETESLNNLVPEKNIKIEDLSGSSIKIVPYDMTSAGQKVLSVSEIPLEVPVETMGGIDFARIAENYNRNIGGASNKEIAKRVAARTEQTRKENLAQGGTGEVFKLPITMAEGSEFFSTYPTDVLKQIVLQSGDKKSIRTLNENLRNAPVSTKNGLVRPFQNFKGIETPEGQMQLLTGEEFGSKGTAGEFRKAFAKEMSKVRNETAFDYNFKDVVNSVLDPRLMNVPKGYGGLSVVRTTPNAPLTPSAQGSKIGAYDTDIAGQYFGSLQLAPIEILMPKTYNRIYSEFQKLYPSAPPEKLRNFTIGAIEKRKENIGEIVDQELIDNYYKYQEGLLGR